MTHREWVNFWRGRYWRLKVLKHLREGFDELDSAYCLDAKPLPPGT